MPPTTVLLRPAIIEIRYADSATFEKAATLYEQVLANREKEVRTTTSCTFIIGSAGTIDKKDILLRLTYPAKTNVPANGTVLYWEVAGTGSGSGRDMLNTVGKDLATVLPSLTVLEPASDATQLPGSATGFTTERTLLGSKEAGSLLGITINPPVPTVALAPFHFGWASGGIGVVIGVIFSLLGIRGWRSLKRWFA